MFGPGRSVESERGKKPENTRISKYITITRATEPVSIATVFSNKEDRTLCFISLSVGPYIWVSLKVKVSLTLQSSQ